MRLLMVGVTAPSHVYPSLAVIRELVGRGHEVTYAVGDRLAELMTPTGAAHVGYRSELPDSDTAWTGDPGEAMQLFLDEEQTALPAVAAADRPDAVLTTSAGTRAGSSRTTGASRPSSSRRPTSRGTATRRTWRSSPPT